MSTLRLSLLGIVVVAVAVLSITGARPALAQCNPTDIFTDDMESGVNGWSTYTGVIGAPLTCLVEWHQDNTDSNSPATSWSNIPYQAAGGANGDEVCLNYLQSPIANVPIGTQTLTLTFWHHYNTEMDDFDFGIVEVSTDGTNWTQASPSYNFLSQPGNGLTFNQETLNMAGLFTPGDPFIVRYRFYSDQLVNGVGWAIDDVTLTACVETVAVEPSSWGQVKNLYAAENE